MRSAKSRMNNRREQYIKRTALVRKERFVLLLVCIFAFVVSTLLFTKKASADNFKTDSDSVKAYKSVTIFAGDTFESIAEEYMSDEYSSVNKYVSELMSINGMNPDTNLVPGNKIIVPYYMSKSITSNPVIEISLAN